MADKTPTPEEICITTNDDRLKEVVWDENMVTARRLWSAKQNLNKVIAHVNTQSEQIRELQLAVFTFNKVLHVYRAALDEFDETTIKQAKRIDHLEELLLESSDDDEYPIVRRNEQTEKWEKVDSIILPEGVVVNPSLDHLMNHHNSDEEEKEHEGARANHLCMSCQDT